VLISEGHKASARDHPATLVGSNALKMNTGCSSSRWRATTRRDATARHAWPSAWSPYEQIPGFDGHKGGRPCGLPALSARLITCWSTSTRRWLP